jgi:hypothetical protein
MKLNPEQECGAISKATENNAKKSNLIEMVKESGSCVRNEQRAQSEQLRQNG